MSYSKEQVEQYMNHIALPERFRLSSKPALDVELLTALHIHQICAIPFETLSLHYSVDCKISLDLQRLYAKFVSPRNRGGYCMESCLFFLNMLRSIGFTAYSVGARGRGRVNGVPQGDYGGWTHTLTIVTLPDGSRYATDVAFGGDGMTSPLPLIDGVVKTNLHTQEVRLRRDFLPSQVHRVPESRVWLYEYRNSAEKEWNAFFSFAELEFLPADYEVLNHFTSTSAAVYPTTTAVVVAFLKDKDSGAICGKRMMVGPEIKDNLNGKTTVVKVCKSEMERLEALKEYFGITLLEEEAAGIRGRPTELLESRE